MRKVVLYTLMSLDGAVDDPGRYFTPGLDHDQEPVFDPVMEANENAIIATQDTVLLGRGMYDEWSQYWPRVHDHPFADFINTVEKHVVTSTPLSHDWLNSTVVQGSFEAFVRDLRARPGGDIGVHGSIRLAQALLAAGLVDELQLVVGPAFGFPGRRLFTSTEQVGQLELITAVPTPSGSVLLGYRCRTPLLQGQPTGTS